MFPWEQAQMGLVSTYSRSVRHNLQQACGQRLAENLGDSDLSPICLDIDKIFCSAWLDRNNVLLGTKCNLLRKVHIPTSGNRSPTWQDISYPAQPMHREHPDLLASSNRAHCGQHDFAVSPSGAYIVTGGKAAEDIILWRLQDSPSSTSSRFSSASGMDMQPVQTFMGHADWVFGLDWLSDRHWVSGSRDGTIKLWQVPDSSAQAGTAGTYTADPGSALLSVGYHQGKVRAVSFDHQQQQVVALSTDETISWWTPDLQLKCGARLMDTSDPVALTTGANIAAVGSYNRVQLLDMRIPNAGLKRNSNSLSGSKRSRSPFCSSAAAASDMGAGHPAAALASSTAGLLSMQQLNMQPRWLGPAYIPRAVRPTVLAVTGSMPGMQQLQQASAAVGMDPLMAEQLLRQEAASLAVVQGKHFDAALEGLLSRLMHLRPSQQLQELTALLHKSNRVVVATLQQQQRQQAEQQRQQAEQQRQQARLELECEEARLRALIQQQQQWQQAELERQIAAGEPVGLGLVGAAARDGEGGAGSELADAQYGAGADPGSPPAQQQQQQFVEQQQQQQAQQDVPPIAGSEADAEQDPDQYSEGYMEEYSDGGQEHDDYDDLYVQVYGVGSGRYGPIGQLDALRQLGPYPLHAPPGVNLGGTLGAPPADVPNALRSIYERVQPNSQLAMNGTMQQMFLLRQQQAQLLQQRLYQGQGAWPPARRSPTPHVLSARQAGKLMLGDSVVRSISIQGEHILGVGHTSMDFYDMRKISGSHISTAPRRPDSSLLLRQVEVRSARMDPVLVRHGYEADFEMHSTVYSHCWDPSGTRVLAAGGALSMGCRGALLHLLT